MRQLQQLLRRHKQRGELAKRDFRVDKKCEFATFKRALVAELVDAIDSKSIIFQVWEFESPRGHHLG